MALSKLQRTLFAATRINRFSRLLLFLSGGLVVVVIAAVVVADRVSAGLISGFFESQGDNLATCNKRHGARTLFWGLLAIEIFAIGRLVLFPFKKIDIDAYRLRAAEVDAASKEHRAPTLTRKRVVLSFVIGALIAYWGSYHMAYGDPGLCNIHGRRSDFVTYWWMWGAYGLRALTPLFALHLWFSPSSSFDEQ